jgi:hypothetical protein
MTQYHALALLYAIKKHDRLAVSKLVAANVKAAQSSPLAMCLLVRTVAQLIRENPASRSDPVLNDFLDNALRFLSFYMLHLLFPIISLLPQHHPQVPQRHGRVRGRVLHRQLTRSFNTRLQRRRRRLPVVPHVSKAHPSLRCAALAVTHRISECRSSCNVQPRLGKPPHRQQSRYCNARYHNPAQDRRREQRGEAHEANAVVSFGYLRRPQNRRC